MRCGLKLGLGSPPGAREFREEGGSCKRHRAWIPEISGEVESKAGDCPRTKEAACRRGHI